LVGPNLISPEVIEFLAGIVTGYIATKGEDILENSTDKILLFLKNKLGKDEFEKVKKMKEVDAQKTLEKLIKDKNLQKEVHAFYVIYTYLKKFTEDSQFLRVMDFRRGEGIPLERMYTKLHIVEEQTKKDQLVTSTYYDEDYYYQAKETWRQSGEPSKKIDPDNIMDKDKGTVCILGLPGAGKTTLCKYFCWKTLKGEYAKQRFPIYIELRGIEKGEDPVTYALHSKLREHFTKKEIEEAVFTIKHNTDIFSPLYIFDGLDEIREHITISKSIQNCADSSVCIATSRRSGFIYLQHDKTYEILPLEKDEKREFVKNYFKQIEEEEKIESFLQVLEKKEYDSLSRNPLLLSILCALASDIEDVRYLPSRKSGLYKRIVAKMNEWYKSKGGEGLSQEEIRILEDFALSLFLKRRPKILFEKGIDENILKRVAQVGLIYRWDELHYSFLHLILQEYFAACSLRSLKERWREIVKEKKDVVSWYEILQLFASILSEEEEYEKLKDFFSIVLESPDFFHLNYALAGHCLAEIDMEDVDWSDEILGKVFYELENSVCGYSFIEAFVHLGARAVEPLLNLLQKTDDHYLKGWISGALGRIGDTRAVEPLLNLLQETDNYILKWMISDALGRIGVRAVEPLLNLLQKTDDHYLRWRISGALGRIGVRAVGPLLNLLQKTDDNNLKGWISGALGRIGDSRAVEPLLNLLQETDNNNLKRRISDALGRIGDSRAVEPLLNLLQETDNYILKRWISDALVKTGDSRAVEPLLDLLQKTDDCILKESISDALGETGDSRAVEPLLDLLQKTDNNDLKGSISDALGRIGDSRAVEPLLDLLQKTDDCILKGSISDALGETGDSRAVEPLLDLLQKTDNNDLKGSISGALSRIGDSRAVEPLLNLLQKTDNNNLKGSISDALSRIGDSRAVEPLLNLLQKTDNNNLRWRISGALSRIGDSRAVEPLLDLLQKTDNNDLKRRISHALENFNPLHLYPFMEDQILQPILLNILCRVSTKFNIRFFSNKVVLPEGNILPIKTEKQRKKAIKNLDKTLLKKSM
jgi:HEAT repeat protein